MNSLSELDRSLRACRRCPRLADHLARVREQFPDYHAAPVLPFGRSDARLLIVGLAPGMHGANRTGRPFTGDYAGVLLYSSLHRYGFADRAESVARDDGLLLIDCRITNAVKCLPPANRPLPAEIRGCEAYLAAELALLRGLRCVLALGRIAHEAVLRALRLPQRSAVFGHGLCHELPGGRLLFDSYHCSRYNTQTRRLTAEMFDAVLAAIRRALDDPTQCSTPQV